MTTPEWNAGRAATANVDETDLGAALLAANSLVNAAPVDPAWIAKLANEFFSALPGEAVAVNAAPAMPSFDPSVAALPGARAESLPFEGVLPSGPGFWDPAVILGLGNANAAPAARLPAHAVPTQPARSLPGVSEARVPQSTSALAQHSQLFYFLEQVTPAAPSASAPKLESFQFLPELSPDLNLPTQAFDAKLLRKDFPILNERVHGKPLIWLDNAATTQKPQSVIDRVAEFYEHENSNIHRAAHSLAARATDAYEAAREKTRGFLNARSTREIVFVRGATEAINLVAQSWGRKNIQADDEILITWLEHHSNIVPWQLLCAEKGARLKVVPVDDNGEILLDAYERLLGPRTRLVSMTHVSNALGTVLPVQQMTEMAHRYGAKVLVDGAQAVSHLAVDIQAIDCDFYVFSGHKVFAPTGIGVLAGKEEVLNVMPPWQGGGNMIADVTFERTVYHPAPMRFEAGTGNIADAVGLGAAIDYLTALGLDNVTRYEHDLLVYATRELERIPGLKLIGTARDKAGVLSLVLDGYRSEEVGSALDHEGIAVRSGHHCAQPALRRFGLESTVRPSLALYNTCEDVDALVAALRKLSVSRGGRAQRV